MISVKFKKKHPDAQTPTRGSEYAAGYDLYAYLENKQISIAPGQTLKIGTGISIAIPTGYFGAIFARSGISVNQGLRPANCVGVCDSDYRGEYIVAIHNDSNQVQYIKHGDKIAQLIILPHLSVEFEEADSLDFTERSDQGFGSTGR